jgi:serine/threonine protein kinase
VRGDLVAFKCLKVRHRNKEDARARMKMEAVVLSELQHANLVQVFDAGVTDSGMVWIAMERLHGQTLREVIHRAGQVSIVDALFYASEIADGVDAVHEVNVIHRDLKPENVFITRRNAVKVLDLGTGKFTGYGLNSTDKMRVIGTTAYMSPEQIKGLGVDARADVYALGLMVYEMIAGHHPLSPVGGIASLPRAVEQVALMQLQMNPPPLASVVAACPRYISAVIERAMLKDRDARYPNMTTFARELRACRKRFIAENRLDDGAVEAAAVIDRGLREKFGAPPRPTPLPPAPARAPSVAEQDTVMDLSGDQAGDGLQTEQRHAPEFHADDGVTPSPHEPTLQLSNSVRSLIPPPYGREGSVDITFRDVPHDDVRNRTTHTNPLLFAPAELTPEPLTMSGRSRGGWTSLFRHPLLRRSAATLGLGALIGVPPAVIGVLWSVHHRAQAREVGAASVPAALPPSTELAASGGTAQRDIAPADSSAPGVTAGEVLPATGMTAHEVLPAASVTAGEVLPAAGHDTPRASAETLHPGDGRVRVSGPSPAGTSSATPNLSVAITPMHRSEVKTVRPPSRPRAKARDNAVALASSVAAPVEPVMAAPLGPPALDSLPSAVPAPAPARSGPPPIILPPSGL